MAIDYRVLLLLSALLGWMQPSSNSSSATLSTQQAIDLGNGGRCAEALPSLKHATAQRGNKPLLYRAGLTGARCAMALQQRAAALQFLGVLSRDFPNDPEVLYVSARYLSQLANGAAEQLATTAPNSVQLRKLNTEALEAQGKEEEAMAEYRKLLQENPKLPELHFRIARLLLEKNPPATEEAKQELNQELRVAPRNAAAEFALGEVDRRNGQWEAATGHFRRATQMDAGFVEAFLALGMSLNAASHFREAIAALERYVKMQPNDPAGHYQLATAYSRTGNKSAAERELAEQRRLVEAQPLRRQER